MGAIPFNKPFLTGKETEYIRQAVESGKISGDGMFTKKCQSFFENKYGFKKVLLTTSCTDALEMAALLLDVNPGDEVIAPSYTFVSTVNSFVLRGAKIVFADSTASDPNIDADQIEDLITHKTKVIIPVHYAGIACDMDKIQQLAVQNNIHIVEDAAQSIDSYYKDKPLGSLSTLAAFSFHETKNIISGEGGMLVINDESYVKRAEIVREKGTNRSAFFRGEVDKYGWVDIGSSYLPSDIIAAFLYAQLENLNEVQRKRKNTWNLYHEELEPLEKENKIKLPFIPDYATNNAHMFYIICKNLDERTKLVEAMKQKNIYPVFHYLSLHRSPYYQDKHDGRDLPWADHYTNCLLRLPMYFELTEQDVEKIVSVIKNFYR
jgi:dTDP-4-amino-4,6-dideoxygalactose transaminase